MNLRLPSLAVALLAITAWTSLAQVPFQADGLEWNHQTAGAPCDLPQPNTVYLTVLTNTVDTFQLNGNPTFVISTQPTNGYLTNLNGSTGQVTYVETNSTATADFFTYCNSNSTTCDKCAPAYVDIVSPAQIACGSCFTVPSATGGVVTGNIFFNTGQSNETVCIEYTNAACVTVTNCTETDRNGTASFFVDLCPGSSNYCIVSLQQCTFSCAFSNAVIAGVTNTGGGTSVFSGTYHITSDSVPPTLYIYTNSVGSGLGNSELFYYPMGQDNLSIGVPQYAILWEPNQYSAVMYTTNPFNCSSGAMGTWTVTVVWNGSVTLPSSATALNLFSSESCATNCP